MTHLGFAGKLAQLFTSSKLTPLIIVASLLVGILALNVTPREEEPQIIVPMVDVMIPFQGATPKEVEQRVTLPAEKLLWGIPDVEYLYSGSRTGGSLITVRFKVGTPLETAVVRIHHKLREYLPEKFEGVGQPLVRSYTIDDVPFLAVTLHSTTRSDFELRKMAQSFSHELSEISDISKIDVIGGEPRQVRILPNSERLAATHVSLLEYFQPLVTGNVEGRVGTTKETDPEWLVDVGGFLSSAKEVGEIVIGIKGGRAVRVKDVADVIDGPSEKTRQAFYTSTSGTFEQAVTLSFAKRPGTNASLLSTQVLERIDALKPTLIDGAVQITTTRDYGATAKDKSDTLIEHLLIASLSVVVLIGLFLGLRPSLVVFAAVPVTLALTLLIYYLFGYTLNRVTLFALIFSIGILVDDAIVVVENIHRHIHDGHLRNKKTLREIVVAAVDEVGNPTILATFTVIAAILPMAFVSGLMGPYMRPIPVGASMAMLFSLIIAFTVSPWAAHLSHKKLFDRICELGTKAPNHEKSKLDRIYDRVMGSLLDKTRSRVLFVLVILFLFAGVVGLIYSKVVRVKMLPFDNKSEFQVVIDLDEGTPLSRTIEVSKKLSEVVKEVPEVANIQIYAGASAPVNFNGLVRHYFLRQAPNQADLQVNLISRDKRKRQSHDIAKAIRPSLEATGKALNARIKVVEIPPGPPVLATLVAEVYGPSYENQIRLASEIKEIFKTTGGVVDVDWSVPIQQDRAIIKIDRVKASLKNLPVDRIYQTVAAAVGGAPVGMIHDERDVEPTLITLQLPLSERQNLTHVLELTIPTNDGSFVPLSSIASIVQSKSELEIVRKNLKRVVYVTGDVAGSEESPVYAIQKLNEKIRNLRTSASENIRLYSSKTPDDTHTPSLKWDGEWQITFEVFRDLGIAFAVVLLLIYLLVVGWFESFAVPFVIMLPIPLSLIGIIPGHWMFNAFFTATSMIGFIAGAGIIVRNSIILVDFIELGLREGKPLRAAVIEAGEIRFRPMLLTAAAVVVGSVVILFDPIFQGLAISLMMGEVAATLLSRFAVPLLYFATVGHRRASILKPKHL